MNASNKRTDEELREIAKEKTKKGNATANARKAQEILWSRSWKSVDENRNVSVSDYD